MWKKAFYLNIKIREGGGSEKPWFHGVMVSTLDFESRDPSSSLGGTSIVFAARRPPIPHSTLTSKGDITALSRLSRNTQHYQKQSPHIVRVTDKIRQKGIKAPYLLTQIPSVVLISISSESCDEKMISLAAAADESLQSTFGSLSADALTDSLASSPLHRAAGKGRRQVVAMLLEAGAEVNAKDRSESSPLHWAAGGGHDAVVELLLSKGVRVNAGNRFGQRAVHYAAYFGHLTTLEILQEGGADVDAKDDNGDTPLHLAASQGHLLALFALVKRGASTNKSNRRGKTPKDMMKKPSDGDDHSMQLFRKVSMSSVMEKWTEAEKELITLQRENKKLQDRLERKTRNIRELNTRLRQMEDQNARPDSTFSFRNKKNAKVPRAPLPAGVGRSSDQCMAQPHSFPGRMNQSLGGAGRDGPYRGKATHSDEILEAARWDESLQTAGRRRHSSQVAGRGRPSWGEATSTNLSLETEGWGEFLQAAGRRGETAGRKGKSPLAAVRDRRSRRQATSSDESLRASGRKGESLQAAGESTSSDGSLQVASRDRPRGEATSSDESLGPAGREGKSLQATARVSELLQTTGRRGESLQVARRDRPRGEATSSGESLQASRWSKTLRSADRRGESLQAAGEATNTDESLQASGWNKTHRSTGRRGESLQAAGEATSSDESLQASGWNESLRTTGRKGDPLQSSDDSLQAAGRWCKSPLAPSRGRLRGEATGRAESQRAAGRRRKPL
ncbi:inversin-like [Penaeus indicus]|uniref:inversin-like n=1 Tax=Penaeus indicus TaxID=29960 RepID=UPI00300CFD20